MVANSTCDSEYIATCEASKEVAWLKNFIGGKYHYIRHRVEDGDIIMNRVSSEENHVDPFMKPLSREKHDGHARTIGMRLDTVLI